MNESGKAVKYAALKHNVESKDIFVVFDDLDIPVGKYKIQFGVGPKNHNGVNDIYKNLGTKDFWHIRIGVENRGDKNISGEDYVLERFDGEEKQLIDIVFKEVASELRQKFSQD